MSDPVFRPDPTAHNSESFDDAVLPHLNAARRLARWIMKNDHDAEDVVQEASLRAFRYFRTFNGGNGRAWFLRIVRNTCSHWHRRKTQGLTDLFDEEQHSTMSPVNDPETLLLQSDTASAIKRAIAGLPDRSRELFVLREVEGLSYRNMADAMDIPMGTVMSSLSRARRALRGALPNHLNPSGTRPATRRRQEAETVLA